MAHYSLHTTVELQKAWYLFTILLDIGRPASVEELAVRCELFRATPDFVRYLCQISASPICIVDDALVFISIIAVSAVGRYFSKATNGWGFLRRDFGVLEPNRFWGRDVKTYFRKRKRSVLDSERHFHGKRILTSTSGIVRPKMIDGVVGNEICLSVTRRISHNYAEVPPSYVTLTSSNSLTIDLPFEKLKTGHFDVKIDEVPFSLGYADSPNLLMSHTRQMGSDIAVQASKTLIKDDAGPLRDNEHDRHMHEVQKDSNMPNLRHSDRGMSCNLVLSLSPPCSSTNTLSYDKNHKFSCKLGNASALCRGDDMLPYVQPHEVDDRTCTRHLSNISEWELENEKNKICETRNFSKYTRTTENDLVHLEGHAVTGEVQINFLDLRNPVTMSNMDGDKISRKNLTQISCSIHDQPFIEEPPVKTLGEVDGSQKCTSSPEKVLMGSAVNREVSHPLKQQNRYDNVHKLTSKVQKFKKISNGNVHIKKPPLDSTSPSMELEKTLFPQFESFIIEEEEGSGGYGTVYRAQRKSDGIRKAIKCPHVNAHKHNVNNELKMLERFGGRNFIIKYEGSFSSGNNECLILEHVEHDRPEVLKKDIDIVQLQWYGYCLFKALAYLHKQGVMHRDVKPGNFLFSRKQNKGYLIDFNLAMDVRQKYSIASKSNSSHHASSDHVPVPHPVSGSAVKDENNFRDLASLSKRETGKSKQTWEHNKNLKKRVYVPLKKYPDMRGGSAIRSQGADGSGITSTKDATSVRTFATENMREPLPCQGRKELLSLVQNALRNADQATQNSSDLRRKRIAAPPGKEDNKIIHPSPMLVHCTGISVAGSRVLKRDAKRKREGSCAGTKGFRAPEVLFRSLHQGPQVDVWSAGVTLLYLMVGRSPFTGDPEQNIKDIAQLRGSEDLWEVAKLHDRESAFPGELFNIKSFPAMDLQSWVKVHTKRLDFFKLIPRSLFDLVDKCLTVNPRQRITADEALRHEFFNSCHDKLRKQRILRRGSSLNSADVLGESKAVQGQSFELLR
ncbi:serine/threonine-protein kinase RIM15-like isoform X2 [Cucurbita moschata]|uniref:non-specific serine/threonine protein kinase n=1 Tax=Cucurbita moschata TaxID=3662 RepID=A0A6J1EY07_CUCMO|nr:serine/threonine-protein kinase RIM15-like isoform X2 [Cucurbita moschata]